MEDSIVAQAKLLLVEVKSLKLQPQSKLASDTVATMILQRAVLRDTLERLIAYIEGYETGHIELLRMVQKLLSITREYHDSQGRPHLNLKPGTGPVFQQLLTDISAYLEDHKL